MIATFVKKAIMKKYIQEFKINNYTYHSLISKNDITLINYNLIHLNTISKSELMYKTKINAIKHFAENRSGNSFVIMNKDMNKNILVNREGLTHSKGRISNEKKNVIYNSAELLSSAIKLNEGYKDGKYTSILFNEFTFNGKPYIVRFIVYDNDLGDLESFKLNSLGVNKNGSRPAINAVTTISTISIKQLLEDVNSIEAYTNCLSIDVLYKLNGDNHNIKYTDIYGLKY